MTQFRNKIETGISEDSVAVWMKKVQLIMLSTSLELGTVKRKGLATPRRSAEHKTKR